jgi:hypothetical protein
MFHLSCKGRWVNCGKHTQLTLQIKIVVALQCYGLDMIGMMTLPHVTQDVERYPLRQLN